MWGVALDWLRDLPCRLGWHDGVLTNRETWRSYWTCRYCGKQWEELEDG